MILMYDVVVKVFSSLNAPITTKVVCFFRLLKCLKSLYGKQCGPRSDCSYRSSSGSALLASILNSSVMLGNYLQQTTFQMHFFLGALRVKTKSNYQILCPFQTADYISLQTCEWTLVFRSHYSIFVAQNIEYIIQS